MAPVKDRLCCICNHNETVVLYKVPICQSCRKVYYEDWRQLLMENFNILTDSNCSINVMMQIVFKFVNDSTKCVRNRDFTNFRELCKMDKPVGESTTTNQNSHNSSSKLHHINRQISDPTISDPTDDPSSIYSFSCRLCKFRRMLIQFKVVPKVKLKFSDNEIIQFGINHECKLDRFYILSTEIMRQLNLYIQNVEEGNYRSKYSEFMPRKHVGFAIFDNSNVGNSGQNQSSENNHNHNSHNQNSSMTHNNNNSSTIQNFQRDRNKQVSHPYSRSVTQYRNHNYPPPYANMQANHLKLNGNQNLLRKDTPLVQNNFNSTSNQVQRSINSNINSNFNIISPPVTVTKPIEPPVLLTPDPDTIRLQQLHAQIDNEQNNKINNNIRHRANFNNEIKELLQVKQPSFENDLSIAQSSSSPNELSLNGSGDSSIVIDERERRVKILKDKETRDSDQKKNKKKCQENNKITLSHDIFEDKNHSHTGNNFNQMDSRTYGLDRQLRDNNISDLEVVDSDLNNRFMAEDYYDLDYNELSKNVSPKNRKKVKSATKNYNQILTSQDYNLYENDITGNVHSHSNLSRKLSIGTNKNNIISANNKILCKKDIWCLEEMRIAQSLPTHESFFDGLKPGSSDSDELLKMTVKNSKNVGKNAIIDLTQDDDDGSGDPMNDIEPRLKNFSALSINTNNIKPELLQRPQRCQTEPLSIKANCKNDASHYLRKCLDWSNRKSPYNFSTKDDFKLLDKQKQLRNNANLKERMSHDIETITPSTMRNNMNFRRIKDNLNLYSDRYVDSDSDPEQRLSIITGEEKDKEKVQDVNLLETNPEQKQNYLLQIAEKPSKKLSKPVPPNKLMVRHNSEAKLSSINLASFSFEATSSVFDLLINLSKIGQTKNVKEPFLNHENAKAIAAEPNCCQVPKFLDTDGPLAPFKIRRTSSCDQHSKAFMSDFSQMVEKEKEDQKQRQNTLNTSNMLIPLYKNTHDSFNIARFGILVLKFDKYGATDIHCSQPASNQIKLIQKFFYEALGVVANLYNAETENTLFNCQTANYNQIQFAKLIKSERGSSNLIKSSLRKIRYDILRVETLSNFDKKEGKFYFANKKYYFDNQLMHTMLLTRFGKCVGQNYYIRIHQMIERFQELRRMEGILMLLVKAYLMSLEGFSLLLVTRLNNFWNM